MQPMTDHEALSLAMFALRTWQDPDASAEEDLTYLDLHADCAVDALGRMRDERQQDPGGRGGRCAGCGWLLSQGQGRHPVQMLNESTGKAGPVEGLAVCNHCPQTLGASGVATALRNRWTSTGN